MDVNRLIEIAKENNVEVEHKTDCDNHAESLRRLRDYIDEKLNRPFKDINMDNEYCMDFMKNATVKTYADDIINMKNYVIETYSDTYNCDKETAEDIVNNSSFMKTLSENPTYVMHYDDEYWVKKIHGELGGKDE